MAPTLRRAKAQYIAARFESHSVSARVRLSGLPLNGCGSHHRLHVSGDCRPNRAPLARRATVGAALIFSLEVISTTGERSGDFAPYVVYVNDAGTVAVQVALTPARREPSSRRSAWPTRASAPPERPDLNRSHLRYRVLRRDRDRLLEAVALE
jgi:hypothetical protein